MEGKGGTYTQTVNYRLVLSGCLIALHVSLSSDEDGSCHGLEDPVWCSAWQQDQPGHSREGLRLQILGLAISKVSHGREVSEVLV